MDKTTLHQQLLMAAKKVNTSQQKKMYYPDIGKITLELSEQILSKTYQPYPYTCFAVCDPTPREILAPHFRDRIIHRWLVDKLEPFIDKRFLSCSYANRKNKGHHKAVKQLYHWLNNPSVQWYLKADIQSFFNSIHHHTLLHLVKNRIEKMNYPPSEKDILYHIASTIITHNPTKNCIFTGDKNKLSLIPPSKSYFNNPPEVGLPLGNLTSQFFANIYLHELDWFIKMHLKAKYYIRYVDDFVLLSSSKEQLLEWREKIKEFLSEQLQLQLHQKKQYIQPVKHGIDFLGYYIKPTHILLRRRVVKQLKRKIEIYKQMIEEKNDVNPQQKNVRAYGDTPQLNTQHSKLKKIQSSLNAYYGLMHHGNCYELGKSVYSHHFGSLKRYFQLSIKNNQQKVVKSEE